MVKRRSDLLERRFMILNAIAGNLNASRRTWRDAVNITTLLGKPGRTDGDGIGRFDSGIS